MSYDVRFGTRLTGEVDRRLRMFALVQGEALSHVLVSVLDQALPSAEELAALLAGAKAA